MAGGNIRILGLSAGLWLMGLTTAFSCEVGEVELFSCPTKAAPQGISMCGQVGEADKTWRGIRYVQAVYKDKFFEYPQVSETLTEPIRFSHRSMQMRYEMNERFTVGKDYYTLYYRDALRDIQGITKDLPEARVEIRSKKGGLLKTIQCTAQPIAYFKEMREASTCDDAPAMVGANCFGKAPEVYLGTDAKNQGKQATQIRQVTQVQEVGRATLTGQSKHHRRRHRRRG